MTNSAIKRIWSIVLVFVMVVSLLPVIQMPVNAAAVNTGVTGLTADSSGSATWNSSGGTITGSVKANSSSGCSGTTYTAQTGTLTFTNNSGATALLSFDYSLTLSEGSVKVDGEDVTAGAAFSKKLNAGETVAVVLTSNAANENATTIEMSSLKLTPEQDVTVTFKTVQNGSYTVDGTTITAETDITKLTTDSFALAAAPANGYKFFGWYSETTGAYFSTAATLTTSFTESQTVEPQFVLNNTPIWQVGSNLFIDLNEATTYASSKGIAKIALVSDGTLPAGDYTIPNGKTLVIPFDDAQTVYTTAPGMTLGADGKPAAHVNPSAFRTLAMASGAKIKVASGGALCVPSMVSAVGTNSGSWNATPTGKHGCITMNGGSSIDVQSSGKLYAWGYIAGSGNVYARSGSEIWECFQIRCWRGGTATSGMANNSQKVFPLNQYYVQNIEAPITYYSGATEKVFAAVNMSNQQFGASATFIGNGGMFQLSSGSMTKRFTGASDRLELAIDGDFTVSPMSLTITGLPLVGTLDLNTADYVLPIQSNITLNVNSGTTTLGQDVAFLPGSELNIADGATVTVASGHKAYVYDQDQWGNYAAAGLQLVPVGYSTVNGTTAKRTAASLVDAKIDVNGTLDVAGALYTTQSGAAIVSSGGTGKVVLTAKPGTETKTYMATQSGSDITYVDIPITAAKLQNADGTYYETAGKPAGTEVPYANGVWGGDVRQYTITWLDDDGETPLAQKAFDYNDIPIYPNNTPTKESTAEYTYSFAGWKSGTQTYDGALPAVTGDATYIAQYTPTVRKYTVTWVVEGVSTVERYDYNVVPIYPNGTPKKEGSAQYSYTFAGWQSGETFYGLNDGLVPVAGDATYTAQFTEVTNTYTVYWVNDDGTVLETDENVAYGVTPEYNGETPTKAATAEFTYTFAGWTPEVTDVTGDVTYKATYTQTTNTYTVKWLDEDGNILETDENVPYGTVPTYDGENPTKAGDAQYSYSFAGWDPTVTAVAGDATYTAQFTEVTNTYTVYWVNDDGTVLETDENVAYGVTPEYNGETPTKAATAEFTYTFDSWTPAVSTVTGTITYTAVYTAARNVYNITFVNEDGTVLDTQPVAYGETPVYAGETPTKAGDAQYSYTFAGWSPEIAAVTCDVTYTATYTQTTNTYTVKWLDEDGNILETDASVPYGTVPTYDGETPTKAATESQTFTFSGWSPAVAAVAGDTTYTAQFSTTVNKYTITWKNDDGTLIQTNADVEYGTNLFSIKPVDPAKPNPDILKNYVFKGWIPETGSSEVVGENDIVTGNAIFVATFAESDRVFTYQWFDGTNPEPLYTTTDIPNQAPEYLGPVPTKGADAQYTYEFANDWQRTDDLKNGVVTFTARFNEVLRRYVITFKNFDGTVLQEDPIDYGATPLFNGETPTKASTARWNYAFSGWTPEITAVTGDTTYTAVFTEIGKNGLCVEGEDTYWIENGKNVPFPGLVKIILDDGTINYYYFGEDGKAVKDGTYKVEKNNGEHLPAYNYNFDANGVIEHDADTSKNGICEGDGSMFYYIDGIKVGEGLLFINGSYYYARTSSAEIVRNRSYYVAKTNGLPIAPGEYRFDTDGKMMLNVNGFVDQDGKTYYYDNGTRLYGFQKVGEDYYFFNAANGSLYKSVRLWVGNNNFGVPAGYYDFGVDGKMVTRNGFFTEGNATYGYSTYYYQNGEKLYGFQKIGEDYYIFNAKSGKMYKDAKMWVGANDYGFEPGYYDFNVDGKMIGPASKNGFVEENGATYYYVDGVLAKGLTKIGDDYYFFNKSSGKLYKSTTLWVGSNDYGVKPGYYNFGADGKMEAVG